MSPFSHSGVFTWDLSVCFASEHVYMLTFVSTYIYLLVCMCTNVLACMYSHADAVSVCLPSREAPALPFLGLRLRISQGLSSVGPWISEPHGVPRVAATGGMKCVCTTLSPAQSDALHIWLSAITSVLCKPLP